MASDNKIAVALIAAAGAVGLTWLYLRQSNSQNTFLPQESYDPLQPDEISIHVGGSHTNSDQSDQRTSTGTAATGSGESALPDYLQPAPPTQSDPSKPTTAYAKEFRTAAGAGRYFAPTKIVKQQYVAPTDGALGFGTPNPTAGWDRLSSDDVRVKFPAFMKAAGYLDPSWDVLRLNRQGNLTVDANWISWMTRPGANGNTNDWARGIQSSAPSGKYFEPFMSRRHVAALYDASVDYAAYKSWQFNGASGILGDAFVSALDPTFFDEFGTVDRPVLTPAQFAEGLRRFSADMSRWMTVDLARWDVWYRAQRDGFDGGDATVLLVSSIAKVGQAVAAGGGLGVILAFASTTLAIQEYNDGLVSLSAKFETLAADHSHPIPTPFDAVDRHIDGVYDTYRAFVDSFPFEMYDSVNRDIARAYIKTAAFNAICNTYRDVLNQISGGVPATSFNYYFTGLTRSAPMHWGS